jgi:hypothetical protein
MKLGLPCSHSVIRGARQATAVQQKEARTAMVVGVAVQRRSRGATALQLLPPLRLLASSKETID